MLAMSNRFNQALASDGEVIRASAIRQLACSSVLAAVAGLVIFTTLLHNPVQSAPSAQANAPFRHSVPIMTTAVMHVPSVMLATAQ
jgi:hypothetical protein